MTVGWGEITGTLKKVEGYTGFSSDPTEQSGHYLALTFTADAGVTIKTQIINGKKKEPITVTDGFCVYRLIDPKTQKISVIFSKDDVSETKTYGLAGLILAE